MISVPLRYSQELRALIGSILQPEQARRPTMEQVLSSPSLRSRAAKYSRADNDQPQLDEPARTPQDQPPAPPEAAQPLPNRPVPPAVPPTVGGHHVDAVGEWPFLCHIRVLEVVHLCSCPNTVALYGSQCILSWCI